MHRKGIYKIRVQILARQKKNALGSALSKFWWLIYTDIKKKEIYKSTYQKKNKDSENNEE